jgi:hypothetical protein
LLTPKSEGLTPKSEGLSIDYGEEMAGSGESPSDHEQPPSNEIVNKEQLLEFEK